MVVGILLNRSIVVILLGTTAWCSCRFHAPLVKFDRQSFEAVDSVTQTTQRVQSYKYPRFSWLWGRPYWTGAYVLNSVYIQDSTLTTKIYSWRSNASLSDGNLKIKSKTVTYSDSMMIVRIDYLIDKYNGPGRRPVFRKSVVWNSEEGKYVEVD